MKFLFPTFKTQKIFSRPRYLARLKKERIIFKSFVQIISKSFPIYVLIQFQGLEIERE